MNRILFVNVGVWDATGAATYPGEVLVEGNRISKVAKGSERLPRDGAETIDAAGCTLIPGLVEGHAHPSFSNAATTVEIGDIPPEEHVLVTMHNARAMLDAGFTSLYGAASAKVRLDVVIRNEIEAGRIVGPRLRAASPEITVTGGLGDERRMHMHRESFALIADGPDEVRRAARMCVREGVDNIKINISGDDFIKSAKAAMTVMNDAEIRAAVEVAQAYGKRVNAHCRAGESVKAAIRCGVDVIYHCEFADDEAIDMLEREKHRTFVGPAVGILYNTMYYANRWGITEQVATDLGIKRALEACAATYDKLRRRGVRVVPGGDYGFAWTPQGTNAKDLELFVKLFGYGHGEALLCATKTGGEIMGMADLGQIRAGFLADLLLVDGDPSQDVSLLQSKDRLLAIMKDGAFHKRPRVALAGGRQAAE